MQNVLTVVEEAINKYGKDNIFLMKEDYHGLYEDDDCQFTYWNNITGTYFYDEWTTRFACPAFQRFECQTLAEGIKNNLVNVELLIKKLKISHKISRVPISILGEIDQFGSLGLRVEVSKGRKWKGVGYLVGTKTKSYQWDYQKWPSNYDYGITKTTYAKIYDPMTGRIEYVNIKHCEIIDEDKLKEKYIKKYNETIDNCTVNDIILGNRCTLKINVESFSEFVKNNTICPDLTDAFDENEYEEKRKASEFKTKKMVELVEWVKNNTDKEGDDIIKLAEGIFRKRY